MASNDALLAQFANIDTDKNGELTVDEVKCFLTKNGFAPQYVKKFMEKYDTNKDGKVTKAEFENHIKNQTPAQRKAEMWETIFASFDKDGSGKLSASELQQVLKQENYDLATLQKFIKLHDKDGDGELNYKEFLAFSQIN